MFGIYKYELGVKIVESEQQEDIWRRERKTRSSAFWY
jgi:hypothetical protein